MLKFIKHHMTSIGDIEIYPVASFLIFFIFFLVVTLLVIKSDKKFISRMENLPLEDPANQQLNTTSLPTNY